MTRTAILIESSRIKGHDDLPGARADVENFTRFLESDFGGAWTSGEIVKLSHPDRKRVFDELTKASVKDYAFISFSGHGHHVVGKDLDETRVVLNDKEEISVTELDPGNSRRLLNIDSCRGITVVEKAMIKIAAFEARASFNLHRRERCRQLFDEAVIAAERGRIVMYSCGINEAAGESNTGGYFSKALVTCSETWANAQPHGNDRVYYTNEVFACAAAVTTRREPQQHPVFEPGRRMKHFAFAVSA